MASVTRSGASAIAILVAMTIALLSGPPALAQASATAENPVPTPSAPVQSSRQVSLVREGDLVVIGGDLPGEAAKDGLLSALRAAGDLSIIDTSTSPGDIPEGLANAAVWAAGVVARLKPGAVLLSDTSIAVEGRPVDLAAAVHLRGALAALPPGFTLQRNALLRPVAKPFPLVMERREGRVVLSGAAASADEAAAIAAFARSFGLEPEGDLVVAEGSPDGVDRLATARFALLQLSRLRSGVIRLVDDQLSVAGEAADRSAYVAVRRALAEPPPAFGVKLQPAAISPPVVSPYRWEAHKTASAIVLRGYVPTDEVGAEIRIAAEALAAPLPVIDEQRLAGGAPDGFTGAAIAGVGYLALVDTGIARIGDRALAVEARASDAQAAAAARAAVAASVPFGFTAAAAITGPAVPPPPPACIATVARLLADGGIGFRFGRDTLQPDSLPRLDRIAEAMQTCASVRFRIAGHTDSDGVPAQNLDLSQRRAQAVVAHLVRRGVEASRLIAEGFGETRPLAPNDSLANKARNRRIEILVR